MQFKKRKRVLLVFALSLATMMQSCYAPGSKDSYLEKFRNFVERVEKHHEDFNKKDWKWADATYEKFSNEWYSKYKNELTTDEELEVIGLKLKYQGYKQPGTVRQIYKELIKDDAAEIKNQINDYIDKDLDEDVDNLIEGMKEIGDSALKVVDDVVEKIDNRF